MSYHTSDFGWHERHLLCLCLLSAFPKNGQFTTWLAHCLSGKPAFLFTCLYKHILANLLAKWVSKSRLTLLLHTLYFFLISVLEILVLKYPHGLENNQHRAFTLIFWLILGFWGWQVWYIFLFNNIRWSCEIYCIKKKISNHIPYVHAFNVNTCIHATAFMQFTSYENSD